MRKGNVLCHQTSISEVVTFLPSPTAAHIHMCPFPILQVQLHGHLRLGWLVVQCLHCCTEMFTTDPFSTVLIFAFLNNLSTNVFILIFWIEIWQGSEFYIQSHFPSAFRRHCSFLGSCWDVWCYANSWQFLIGPPSLCFSLCQFLDPSFFSSVLKFQPYAITWGIFCFYLFSGFMVGSFILEKHVFQLWELSSK